MLYNCIIITIIIVTFSVDKKIQKQINAKSK